MSNSPYANLELARLRKKYDIQAIQAQQEAAMLEQQVKHLMHEAQVPFDETKDFRDFVVWLCGVTEAKRPPSQEDWENLRDKTKQIAAKFALRAKDQAAERLKQQVQPDLFQNNQYHDHYNKMLGKQLKTHMDSAAYSAMNAGTNTFTTGATVK